MRTYSYGLILLFVNLVTFCDYFNDEVINMNLNLSGKFRVAGRLHNTAKFQALEKAAEEIENTLRALPPVKGMAVKDKQSLFKKLESKRDAYTAAWTNATALETINFDAIEAKIKEASIPRGNDFSMTPLLAGKTNKELLELAQRSPSVARLLANDVGLVIGLSEETQQQIARRLSPELAQQFDESLAILEVLNRAQNEPEIDVAIQRFGLTDDDEKTLELLSE